MTLKTKRRITKATAVAAAFLLMAAGCYAVISQSQETAFAEVTEEIEAEEPETEAAPEEDAGTEEEPEEDVMRVMEVFMEIDTVALDKASGTHTAKAVKQVTIIDTVSYTDASPEDDYHLEAALMDKKTGEPVMVDGKAVTARQAFDPEGYDGTAAVEITFDARGMGDRDVVVFEKLINDSAGFEEAAHEDISDGDQTVSLVEPTPAEKVLDQVPKTGDKEGLLIAGILGFTALAGAAAAMVLHRKKVNR